MSATFSYTYTRNINDLYQLQLFIKNNGFADLLYLNYSKDTYLIEAAFLNQLSITDQTNLSNLILTTFPNNLSPSNEIKQISIGNCTSNVLGASQVFTGQYEDVSDYSTISIILNTDTNSVYNGLELHFSIDGKTENEIKTFNIQGGGSFSEIVSVVSQYFKIVYRNSVQPQTKFNLQSIYHRYKPTDNPVVTIKEESGTPTGGNFRTETFTAVVPANTTQNYDYSWPYPISVIVLKFTIDSGYSGDVINCYVAPNTTVGVLTAPINSVTNIFNVNSTVIQNTKLGYQCNLIDSNGAIYDLGDITNINYSANQITTVNNASIVFAAGTYFQITINNVRNYSLGLPGQYVIGDSKIGASYIPAGRKIRLKYTNSGSTIKNFVWCIEYLY
jgi:hypothetical protein